MARHESHDTSEWGRPRDGVVLAGHRTRAQVNGWVSRLAGSLALVALLGGQASAQWRQGGIPVSSSASSQYSPCAVPDGHAGAYVAWLDMRSPASIRVQHVRQDGTNDPLWPAAGVIVPSGVTDQSSLVCGNDGGTGLFVAWTEAHVGSGEDVYAQHVWADGTVDASWPSGGRVVCNAVGAQGELTMAAEAGHAYLVWSDWRGVTYSAIYAQYLDTTGYLAWPNGLALSTGLFHRRTPDVVSDQAHAYVTWCRSLDSAETKRSVRVQRISPTGVVPGWPDSGAVASDSTQLQREPRLAVCSSGGVYVGWEDHRGSTGYDIRVQKFGSDGARSWAALPAGSLLCVAPGDQTELELIPDGASGAIACWRDRRSGDDLYAQRIDEQSQVHWTANGRAVCSAAGAQSGQRMFGDGLGGAVIAWVDERATEDIYAMHVLGSTGEPDPAWPIGGKALCIADGRQTGLALADQGNGYGIAFWDHQLGTNYDNTYGRAVMPTLTSATVSPAINIGGGVASLVTPEGLVAAVASVDEIDTVNVTITPSPGYFIQQVTVDGSSVDCPPNYVFRKGGGSLVATFGNTVWAQTVNTSPRLYRGVSFPLGYPDHAVSSVLAPLGPHDDSKWRLAHYDPISDRNGFAGAGVEAINAGTGYWLVTATGAPFEVTGVPLSSTIPSVTVDLAGDGINGWNQIGNPFRFPIAVAALEVSGNGGAAIPFLSGANVYTEHRVLEWADTGYVETQTLRPFRAYWVNRTTGVPVTLNFPNRSSIGVPVVAPIRPADSEWALDVSARQAGAGTARIQVGSWGSTSTPPLRAESPPSAPGGALRLLVLANEGREVRRLADFAPRGGPWAWTLEIAGAEAPGEVTLEFAPHDLPPGLRLWLEDPLGGWRREVPSQGALSIAAGADPRQLTLRASFGEVASADEPVASSCTAYPNPFHERLGLAFRLASPSDLRVELFDLQGRLVRALDRRGASPGESVLTWDGRRADGTRAPAGVYLARFRVNSANGVVRLVKID